MSSRDRLRELYADQAAGPLDPNERAELEGLALRFQDEDGASWERAAAAIAVAATAEDPVPEALRLRLEDDAAVFFDAAEGGGTGHVVPFGDRRSVRNWAPWLAAAAAVILAVIGWWPRLEAPATASERRSALLAATDDVVTWTWSAADDPAARGATGDVVWSTSRQEGYLRIVGLEANDIERFQYQLWIFDTARSSDHPVDGGVFDIDPDRTETVIPIDPRVPVARATLFAVTVERPGGVVVSKRKRIVLTAQPRGQIAAVTGGEGAGNGFEVAPSRGAPALVGRPPTSRRGLATRTNAARG